MPTDDEVGPPPAEVRRVNAPANSKLLVAAVIGVLALIAVVALVLAALAADAAQRGECRADLRDRILIEFADLTSAAAGSDAVPDFRGVEHAKQDLEDADRLCPSSIPGF